MGFNLIQVPSARNTSASGAGPLADLATSNFTYNIYQYPLVENEDSPTNSHNVLFYINIPEKSYWNTDALAPTNGNQVPTVNSNAAVVSRFGLRTPGSQSVVSGSPLTNSASTATAIGNLALSTQTKRTSTAISLYIPDTMVFSQHIQYENVSLTGALGIAGDVGYALALSGVGPNRQNGLAVGAISSAVTNALNGIQHYADTAGTRNIFLQANNVADNPQNLLLFKQVDFRKFQFDFILTPESQQESNIIQEIIYQFRFHSAPEVLTGSLGRFFVPPSNFDIQFIHNGSQNPYVPKISTCVLNSVTVNYCESGRWSTYYDGSPLQTRLTLDFTEIEIITKDRVQDGF